MDAKQIWFERDHVRLFAAESGEGMPIMLIHGGLANHQTCRLFARPLFERFRIITPDLRGSGRSIYAVADVFRTYLRRCSVVETTDFAAAISMFVETEVS